jgi:MFS family permease
MVLFAQEKLGLDAVGFGLLFSGSAVGGVLGCLVAARVTRVVGTARVTVWTMVASALAYLVFGLSSDPWLAGVMFGLVGFLTVVFNVILGSLRQALTPDRLLGRVISAFRLFSYGTVPLGSLLGGVLARSFGLRAPFVGAGVVIPLAAVLCLPAVNARTLAEARAAAGLEPVPDPGYIRSGASTPIRARVLPSTRRVALTSHQRALERAWSSPRTRHSA